MSGAKHPSAGQQSRSPWVNALLLIVSSPYYLYQWVVSCHRPDVINQKTREEHWKALRSHWRWVHAAVVYLGPPSYILWNIKWPLLCNMVIAAAAMADAVALNDLFLNDTINASATLMWKFSSFMLALLMAFKVNRVYDRWWTGRQAFAGVGSAAYALSQQSVNWIKDQQLRDEIIRWCKVWQFSVFGLLRNEKTLHPLVADLLSSEESAYYSKARKGRHLITLRLQQLLKRTKLDMPEAMSMHQWLTRGMTDQGSCTRIMYQCMPYGLTLMCSGFLEVWLLIMPFGLFSNRTTKHNWSTSAFELLEYALICILMLGVDEVASQLEQPFPQMPLLEIVESTLRDINRLADEAATVEKLGDEYMGRVQQQQNDVGERGASHVTDKVSASPVQQYKPTAGSSDAVVLPMDV